MGYAFESVKITVSLDEHGGDKERADSHRFRELQRRTVALAHEFADIGAEAYGTEAEL